MPKAKDNASIMRQRIVLQKRTMTLGAFNEPLETWTEEDVMPGSFEPLTGREFWSNSGLPQKDAQADARIRVRLRKGIDPAEHKIVYAGIVYDIVAPPTYDRERRQTHLMVKAMAKQQPNGSKVNV